jgi:hypothetical protein
MKDKKTLKEFFAEARRAKYDSLGIANDPEMLNIIKTLAEEHGDLEHAKEINEQVEKLKGLHTKEKILEILNKDHVYYSATRLSITALYDGKDVFDNLLNKEVGMKLTPVEWALCWETDEIDYCELNGPLTLHVPIEHFDCAEDAVDRFNVLHCLVIKGIDISKRCKYCRKFDGKICGHNMEERCKTDIGCEYYEYNNKFDND